MKRLSVLLSAMAILCFALSNTWADMVPVTIDFEDYTTDTIIYDQYSHLGVIFTGQHSDIFTPSIQNPADPVNGYEFPTHSGQNALVASDWERIIFPNTASDVSFYYTSGNSHEFEVFAYDLSGNLLDSLAYYYDTSNAPYIIYVHNTYSVSRPQKPLTSNMLAQFNVSGISYIDINPNHGGGGVVIDDLAFTPVPVPSAILLGSIGLTFTGWLLKRKRML